MAVETTIDRLVYPRTAVDRWIYVSMAVLFLVIAVSGFYPTSTALLAAVNAGTRPPAPLVLHIHAFLMVSWLFLFLSQTTLMALGRRTYHMALGLASFALIPAIVLSTIAVTIGGWRLLASGPPGMDAGETALFQQFISNILLIQTHALVLFLIFACYAILVRVRDSEAHKRLMVLATLMPLTAAVGRLVEVRINMPDTPVAMLVGTLLLLAPVLIYDTVKRGRPHRVYVNGMALYAITAIPVYWLWENPWWLETVPGLMGVG